MLDSSSGPLKPMVADDEAKAGRSVETSQDAPQGESATAT
jgi:hypothetical protein